MPNRRIGQWRRRETILECVITAFPQAVNFWSKDGRRLTGAASSKHRVEVYDETRHRLTLSLRVHVSDDDDFGEYTCVASNSLGRVEQVMTLYGAYTGVVRVHLRTGRVHGPCRPLTMLFQHGPSSPWVLCSRAPVHALPVNTACRHG